MTATLPASAVCELLAIESDFVSADTLLAQMMQRFASLPLEGTASRVAALSEVRTRLLCVLVSLDGPIAEAVRVREFEASLEDLPF
jgi:hypothetical protein